MKKLLSIALSVCIIATLMAGCSTAQKSEEDTTIGAQQAVSEENTSEEPTSESTTTTTQKAPESDKTFEDEKLTLSVPDNCYVKDYVTDIMDQYHKATVFAEVKDAYITEYKEEFNEDISQGIINQGLSIADVSVIKDIDYVTGKASEKIRTAEDYAKYSKNVTYSNLESTFKKTKVAGCDACILEFSEDKAFKVASPQRAEYYIQADKDTIVLLVFRNYMTDYTSEIDSILNSVVIK